MERIHITLPDDTKWTYDRGIDGRPTGGAHLPATEVLAILLLVEYLTEQISRCYAIAPLVN